MCPNLFINLQLTVIVVTLIPICEIRSKSLVGHYSGKEIEITNLRNLLSANVNGYLFFIIYNNDPHYRIDRLGSLCASSIDPIQRELKKEDEQV